MDHGYPTNDREESGGDPSRRPDAARRPWSAVGVAGAQDEPVRIGSKDFTEQLILGEMYALLLENAGIPTERGSTSAAPRSRRRRCSPARSTSIRNTPAPG